MFVILPVIFTIAGLFFALRFKITPTRHRVMMAEIERLRGGGSKDDVSPDTRRVCERLTGLSYEKLFMK
jgi:oligogalacturonide transporter